MKHQLLCFTLATATAFLGTSSTYAASETWAGATGAQNWNASGNWSNGTIPGATTGTANTDTATFNTAVASVITIDSGRNIGSLTFDGAAGAFTIGGLGVNLGSSLLLSSGGAVTLGVTPISFTGVNLTETINAPLVLEGASATTAGTYTFTNNETVGGSALKFAGGISGGTTSTVSLTLNGTSASAANVISGIISNGSSSALSLTKTGSGTWVLSGNNTYTGTTTVNAGTLLLNTFTANNDISSSSALVLGGGTLNLTGKASTASSQTFNGTTINAGASTIGLTAGSSGTMTINLGAITRNTGGTLNFTAAAATGAVANFGSATNTNGILGPWATIGSGATLNYGSLNASGNLVAYTAGTAAATAANLGTDTTGTVNYNLASASGTTPATVSANTIRYTGSGGTLASGATLFSINGLMNAGTGTLTVAGSQVTIGSNKELVVENDNQATVISSNIVDNSGGASGLTFSSPGGGSLILSGTNTYTGMTTIGSGMLQFTKEAALYNDGAAAAWSGTNIVVGSGGTMGLSVGGGGSGLFTASDITTLLGLSTSATTGFEGGSTLALDTTAGDFTYSGAIANTNSGNNALGLTKLGTNALILTGAGSYTGNTAITNGSLFVDNTYSGMGLYGFTGMNAASTFVQGSPSSAATYSTLSGVLLGGNGTITSAGGLSVTGFSPTDLAHLAPGLQSTTAVSNAPTDFGASSIGTLNITGPVTLGADSSFDVYFDSQNSQAASELNVTGAFTITSTPTAPSFLSFNALTSDSGWNSDTNFGVPLTIVASTGTMTGGSGFANAFIAAGQTVSSELIYAGGGSQDFYVTYNTASKAITLTPIDSYNALSNFTQNSGTVNDTWSNAAGSGAANWNNGNGAFNLGSSSGGVIAFEGGQTLASGAAITSTDDIATGTTVGQTGVGAPFSYANAFLLNSLDLNGTGPASGTASVTINGNTLDFSTGTNSATATPNTPPTIFLSANGAGLTCTLANNLVLSANTYVAGAGSANFNFSGSIVGPGTLEFVPGLSTTMLTLSGANSSYADVGGITTGASSTLKFGSNFYSLGALTPGASSTIDLQGNTVAFSSLANTNTATFQSTGGPGYVDLNFVGTTTYAEVIGANVRLQQNASGSSTVGVGAAGNLGIANFGSGIIVEGGTGLTSATQSGLFGGIKGLPSGVSVASGNILLNGGTLWLQGSGAVVGQTGQTTLGSQLLYGGGGVLEIDGKNSTLTYTAGNASDTTAVIAPVSGSAGTLVLAPTAGAANLGVTNKLIVTGAAGALPTNTNGIASPTIFVANNDANQTGDFVSYNSTSGFVSATTATTSPSGTATGYSATGATSLTGATSTSTVDVSSNQTVSNSTTAAYALRVGSGDTVTISGSNTLTLGNGSGAAGLILNGGAIAGGSSNTLAFGGAEAVIYTSLANGTIGTDITGSNTSFGLVKTGAGTLFLTGGASSLAGAVVVDSGALDVGTMSGGNLPATQLDLYGGVIQGNGTFSLNLATGTAANDTVSVGGLAGASLGGGGFAAKGGALIVDLNGGTGTVTWGGSSSDFLQDTTTGDQSSQALVFGSNSSDSQVNFQNGIALGATNPSYYREVYVSSGTGTDSALISGVISDTAGSVGGHGLLKDGAGSLILTGNNSYAGLTQVSNGALFINGTTTSAQGSYTVAPITLTNILSVSGNTAAMGTPSFNSYGNVNGATTANGQKTTVGALLGGTGTINLAANQTLSVTGSTGDVAHFAPGLASGVGLPTTGTLTVGTVGDNNSVTMGTFSSFDIYLDGNNAQAASELVVNGALNLNSTSGALSINDVTGDTGWNTNLYTGEVFNIVQATSITGTFSGGAGNLALVQTQNSTTGALNLLSSYNTSTPGSAAPTNISLTNLGTQYFTATTSVNDTWSGANTTGAANWNNGNGTGITGGLASGPSSAITFDAGKTFGASAVINSVNDIATGLTVNTIGSSNTNVFQLNYLNLGGTVTGGGSGDQVNISGNALEFVTNNLNGDVSPTVVLDSIGLTESVFQSTYTISNNIILNSDTLFTTAYGTSRSTTQPGGEVDFTGTFSGTGALNYNPQDIVNLGYNLTLGSDTTAGTNANTGYAYQGNIAVDGGTLYIAIGSNTSGLPEVKNDFYTTGSLFVAAGAAVNVGTSNLAVSGLTGTGTITGGPGVSNTGGISVNNINPITDVFGGILSNTLSDGFAAQGIDRFNGSGDFTFSNPTAVSVGGGGGSTGPGSIYNAGTGVLTLTGPFAGPIFVGFGLGSTKIAASNTSTGAPALGISSGTTFNSGTLWIQPQGTGGNASVVAKSGSSIITFYGGATINLDRGDNSSVTLSTYYGTGGIGSALSIQTDVGSGGAFGGVGAGSLVLTDPNGAAAIGTTDHFVLVGAANSVSTLLLAGSNVAFYNMAIADNDVNATGDFATYIGSTGTVADAGFESAATAGLYTAANTNHLASATATSLEYVNTSGQIIAANTSTGPLRIDGTNSLSSPNVTINSGVTLTLNNNLILNGGTIAGSGTLVGSSSTADLGIYTSLLNGTISAFYSNTANYATLVKYGPGTLYLTNTANFGGMELNRAVALDGGALDVGAMSGGTTSSNSGGLPQAELAFQGGVLQGNGSFSRPLGVTGAVTSIPIPIIVNFQDGGFAGDSATTAFTIDIGGGLGTTGSLVWGQTLTATSVNGTGATPTGFLGDTATLMFGSNTSSGLVNFTNGLDLGAESSTYWRDIFVTAGGSPAGTVTSSATKIGTDSALISGLITDTSGVAGSVEVAGDHGLLKDGDGTLILSANNTYSGFTDVSNGALFITGATVNQGNYTVSPLTNTTAGIAVSSVSGTNATFVQFNPVTGNYDTINGSLLGGSGSIGLAANQSLSLSGTTTVQAGTNTSTTGVYSNVVAHLAPGVTTSVGLENIGSLTVGTPGNNNSVLLGVDSALDIYMSATAAGSAASELIINGSLSIDPTAVLNFNLEQNAPGFNTSFVNGSPYTIVAFTPGDLTGTFDGYTNGSIVSDDGLNFILNYNESAGTITLTLEAIEAAYFNGQGVSLNTAANFDTSASSQTAGASVGSQTNVFFSANRNTSTSATITAPLVVNSVNFGAGSGTNSGITISSANNTTDNLTINAANVNGNTGNTGISIAGNGTDTINAPVVLGASQTWSIGSGVNAAFAQLNVGGQVSGTGFSLTKAGAGTVVLSNATGNTYSGGTTVSAGTLIAGNTSGSAIGTGSLTVNGGATIGGYGSYGSTANPIAGFNISGSGTTTTTRANVLAGLNSASDNNTTQVLALVASAASTIQNANLTFNLNAKQSGALGSNPSGSGTELSVGNTAISFGSSMASVQLTLNLENEPGIVPANTPYVLIAGTQASGGGGVDGSQYSGLILGSVIQSGGGVTETVISGNNLELAFGSSTDQQFYEANSYLVLYQNTNTGVDNIDVIVVPEPGTWAMMLGGLAMLVFWQRRKFKP